MQDNGDDIQKIVRLAETNLDGTKSVEESLRKVKGISAMLVNAVAVRSGLRGRKLGSLSESELSSLEKIIMHPEESGIPAWMWNRRRDPETGGDRHIVASTLELTTKSDINEMKKIKSYRGVRHIHHLPVRGQRTRGSFRKGKTMGVSKKKKG
jgi:small subunit ribosomal protein S13